MRKKVLEEFGNLESKTVGLLHDMELSNGHLLSESLLAPFQASNTENIDGTEANASSSFTLIGFVNFENAGFGLAASLCVKMCEALYAIYRFYRHRKW